jgi:hypothetical protein
MHPLLGVAAVLVGAKLAGLWGALFGVPITAVIVAMVSFYRLTLEERRQRLRGLQPVGGHAAGVGHEADELGSDLVAATVAPGSTPTA